LPYVRLSYVRETHVEVLPYVGGIVICQTEVEVLSYVRLSYVGGFIIGKRGIAISKTVICKRDTRRGTAICGRYCHVSDRSRGIIICKTVICRRFYHR